MTSVPLQELINVRTGSGLVIALTSEAVINIPRKSSFLSFSDHNVHDANEDVPDSAVLQNDMDRDVTRCSIHCSFQLLMVLIENVCAVSVLCNAGKW